MQFRKSEFWWLYGLALFIVLGILSCNDGNRKSVSVFSAQDTTNLIQTMLDDKKLNDTLFSQQISQQLLIHKNKVIPDGASFTYKGANVIVRPEKIETRYIDYEHPRFIMVFGKCVITDTTSLLSFDMPDVGMGITTNWKRKDKNTPWVLTDWSDAHY